MSDKTKNIYIKPEVQNPKSEIQNRKSKINSRFLNPSSKKLTCEIRNLEAKTETPKPQTPNPNPAILVKVQNIIISISLVQIHQLCRRLEPIEFWIIVSCKMNLVSNPGRQQSKNTRLRPISAGGQRRLLFKIRGWKTAHWVHGRESAIVDWKAGPHHHEPTLFAFLSSRFERNRPWNGANCKTQSFGHDYYPGTHPACRTYARRRLQLAFFDKSAKTFSNRSPCLMGCEKTITMLLAPQAWQARLHQTGRPNMIQSQHA